MTNKAFEIYNKDIAKHRITVTPTRITIKLKSNATDDEKNEVIRIGIIVAKELENVTQSYRGTILTDGFNLITLYDDKKNSCITVKY